MMNFQKLFKQPGSLYNKKAKAKKQRKLVKFVKLTKLGIIGLKIRENSDSFRNRFLDLVNKYTPSIHIKIVFLVEWQRSFKMG